MELKRIANKAVITFFIILHLPKQSAQKYTSFTYYSKLSDYLVKYFMGKIKKPWPAIRTTTHFFWQGQ